jgi:hypothetical protein
MINISELIKNDKILSQLDYETAYRVVIRLIELGYIPR